MMQNPPKYLSHWLGWYGATWQETKIKILGSLNTLLIGLGKSDWLSLYSVSTTHKPKGNYLGPDYLKIMNY